MGASDWLTLQRRVQMATLLERVQAAWATGDPLALHREVEQLAAEGHSRQALENALEALLLAVRTAGDDDEKEEIINGVWDRLTGWCHASRHIGTPSSKENGARADSQINGETTPGPLSTPSTSP
jgi:hypothetical protein